jgi:hypothetical protein
VEHVSKIKKRNKEKVHTDRAVSVGEWSREKMKEGGRDEEKKR